MPDHQDTITLLSIALVIAALWASVEVLLPEKKRAVDPKRRKY